jgi:hypothetical protein
MNITPDASATTRSLGMHTIEPVGQPPRVIARFTGLLYLVVTVSALFGEAVVRGKLVAYASAERTATNILAHEQLYRAGGAADLLAFLCDTAIAVLLYQLLRPVSRGVSSAAAFFRLGHAAVASVNTVNYLAPLVLLSGAGSLGAFSSSQLQEMALTSLRIHGAGYNIALIFFGVHCVLVGYLIARSAFLPKLLGVLMVVAGACYLVNSFAAIVSPDFKSHIYPYILIPAGIGEWALMAWLIVVGVDGKRWHASMARPRPGDS